MVKVKHEIVVATEKIRSENHEFFKAVVTSAFKKDPEMEKRYHQVELDYDAAIRTANRRTDPQWEKGPMPSAVFPLADAARRIKSQVVWVNRARYLAHSNRLPVRWFFVAGKWIRCVSTEVLQDAFDKYYPGGIV